jgi:hypothetical protein
MGIASGLVAQVGFAEETTPGTRVTPTRFYEFTQESLRLNKRRMESKGLRANRVVGPNRWASGSQDVTGGVTFECAPQGFGLLLKHAIGPNATTGAGPYTHTFASGGILDTYALTCQLGRPSTDGTVRPFDYLGLTVTDWSLDAAVNEFLMMTLNLYGMDEQTNQTLATASYPATITPFTYLQGSLTIAGAAQDIKSIGLKGDNAVATGRHQIRATTPALPKQPLQNDRRSITGSLTADFVDLTLYNRFVTGTEAAMVLAFVSGTNSLTITANVRFDGETPNVGGAALLDVTLPFICTSQTSDAAAFTAVLVNGDTLP